MMVVPVQAFADISPEELPQKETDINGLFEISTKIDNQWINAGNLEFGKFQERKEIDLGEYLKGNDALIKITQKGGGASYLDAVFLDGMRIRTLGYNCSQNTEKIFHYNVRYQ
jgi:hypothetical protein